MTERKVHAISLFSGGLDSCLAVLLMLKQNVRVTALTFATHFGCDPEDRSSCAQDPYPTAEKFGFEVKLMHLGQEFVDIVAKPKYGYGKNMNPCVDCRILMLSTAREYMEMVGADFVVTGEVIGQRPFSQMRGTMNLTMRESGLQGRLLRPLSAKLLEPTIPEIEGLVDREQLEGIHGRSRQRQMELAEQYGLEDYPSPAGGCLLTDPEYSRRLRDLLDHQTKIDFSDLNLLRAGRHFRFSPQTKIVVGRNKTDNEKITTQANPDDLICEAIDTGSPITLVRGEKSEKVLAAACSLTARYCDRKRDPEVVVSWSKDGQGGTMVVRPAAEEEVQRLRV